MNGRIYDPLLGRMLSADVVVQFPSSLQSYNRYSYVRNNPLTFTDPTGWWEFKLFGLTFGNENSLGGRMERSVKEALSHGSKENFKANVIAAAKSVDRDFQEGGPFLLLAKYTSLPGGAGLAGPTLRLAGAGEAVVATDTVYAAANAIAGTAAVANMASGDIKPTEGSTVDPQTPPTAPKTNGEKMAEVRAKGAEGEAKQQSKIAAEGETTTGTQVTFETSKGTRAKIDATTTDGQKNIVREAKNGEGAELSRGQRDLKADVEQGNPVIPRGENARKAGYPPGRQTILDEFKEDRFR